MPDIALIGKAGVGKSSAASYLVRQQCYRSQSFAGPLKDIAVQLWGEEARTDRVKLQALGCAVREIDPNAWVNVLLHRLTFIEGPVVVDDVRFPNEWWALKGAGFVMVKILAPIHQRIDRLKKNGKWSDVAALEHESETALDDRTKYPSDYVIHNWMDPNMLEAEVFRIISKELK